MNQQVNLFDKRDLHVQVKDIIVQHIQRGNYKQNSRLPGYRHFARIANVSAPTVQQAVESLVQEGVLYARQRKGTYVRMIPGVTNFKRQKTGIYACVTPNILSNTVVSRVYALDDLIFSKSSHHMLLSNTKNNLQRDVEVLDSLLKRDLDALIYQPYPQISRRPVFARAIKDRLNKFIASRIPVVLLDRMPDGGYDTVLHSEWEICELALKHLIGLGHRRIVFVVQPEFYQPKIETFREVCKSLNLSEKQIRFVEVEGDDPFTGAKEAMERFYDEYWPFTAIIAASDSYAIGCYYFLKSKGVKCPEDVSIIGADNLDCVENEFTKSLPIGLTTIWAEPLDVAQKIYERIEFRLNEEEFNKTPAEVIEVTPTLVLRESTACPSLTFGEPNQ